jgi:hypothetical protein
MTMYHHDANKTYEQGRSEAATKMRAKLHSEIDRHRASGQAAVEKVIADVPRDRYRFMSSTEFELGDGNTLIANYSNDAPETIHPFALGKICETISIPREFIGRLMGRQDGEEHWGSDLALDLLNKHFKHQPTNQDRRMIRSVGTQTRGFMSDSYARLHPGKLMETFAKECKNNGLIPYGGHAGDTKFMINAVLDRVIEPVKDEVLSIGVVFKESAYGDGATELSVFMQRMWCTNTAISSSELRKVHLGAKAAFDGDEADQNYQLQTASMCAEIRKAFQTQLNPAYIAQLEDGVRKAHEAKVNHTQFESFLKKHLSKNDVETVKEKYRSTDISDLPAGDNWWRASNALSWFANQVDDKEKAYDLQKLAGQAIQIGARA